MAEKQNKEFAFFFSLLIIIVVSFLILTPKISSILFPMKRQAILQSFINDTKQGNRLDAQKFWEFREFYSPGYFNFNRIGLTNAQIKTVENKTGISINAKYVSSIFLMFTSQHLNSFEALVTTKNLQDLISDKPFNSQETIFSDNNTWMYKDNMRNIHVIFLKPLSEMERANGFLSYNDVDKNLVLDKNWLVITTLDEK